jgi:hypothetical protein
MSNKWSPLDSTTFLIDYQSGMSDYELAQKHNASPDRVGKYLSHMRHTANWPTRDELAQGKQVTPPNLDKRSAFIAFLSRAKTRVQINEQFGESEAEELLVGTYTGYHLFTTKNGHGQSVYSLLPEVRTGYSVAPRVWGCHIPLSDNGDFPQGYQMVSMPDFVFKRLEYEQQELRLVPLFDVHYGHHAHKAEKFDAYIQYIKDTPNVFTWGGGDLLENALDDGRGMSYEQSEHPSRQIDVMAEKLAPIAHKILFLQPGNHEWRTYNKAGIEPTQVLAKVLNIPYFDGPVILDILGMNHRWRIHSQHGNTNSRTKGGKMNAAAAPRRWTNGVNFFVSGHVHDPIVNSETLVDVDPVEGRLVYLPQYTVVAPSFMGFEGTYAYRAGYSPPGLGGVSMSLYADGAYEARLHNRH